MKTPQKACLYDRNGRRDSNGRSISTNLAKREIARKKEGRRDKRGGGGMPTKRGIQKNQKEKQEREKEREQKLVYSLDSLFVHWEICFSQSKCLFLPSLPSTICLIFPLWSLPLFTQKLVVLIKNASTILYRLCF